MPDASGTAFVVQAERVAEPVRVRRLTDIERHGRGWAVRVEGRLRERGTSGLDVVVFRGGVDAAVDPVGDGAAVAGHIVERLAVSGSLGNSYHSSAVARS